MVRRIRSQWLFAGALAMLVAATQASANDLMYGCCGKPACGKVCKLVCEEATLVVTCYGCECDTICVPGPSKPGCKHCVTTCCNACGAACGCGSACGCGNGVGCCSACGGAGCNSCCGQSYAPKCEFCWRDWIACGCAKPRTVKVLTKYEAERKICSYHWEVVDGCGCGGSGVACGCDCVYKPAPADALVGQTIPLSNQEQVQLASWMEKDSAKKNGTLAEAFRLPELEGQVSPLPPATKTESREQNSLSPLGRLSSLFGLGK